MADQQPEASVEPTQTSDAPQETTQDSQPDILGQINQRMDQFGQELPNLVSQALEQQYGYEDPYGQDQFQQQDPYAQQGFQQQQDPYGGLDPNDPIQAQLIQTRQALDEIRQGQQATNQELWSRDLNAMFEKYPDIKSDPKVSQAVIENLRGAGIDPNTMVSPRALEMAYKAHRADVIASQQQPLDQAQQNAVTLEGATAQQQQPEVDPVQELFGAPPVNNPVFGWAQR